MKIGEIKTDNYEIRIESNDTDDFSQLSIVNGLYIKNGGTHIEYILDKVIPPIRERLQKTFKTIKPADIKNKMKLMVVMRKFGALEFTSQEKVEVSNSQATFKEFFNNIDWEKITKQLLKDQDLILNITEYFRLKEQVKESVELKKLATTTKVLHIEKYTEPTQFKKRLFICEGESASGGLIPTLGRKNNGFYELKGVPLNAWEITPSKVKSSNELSNLYTILKQEKYEEVVIATDADLDGNHITGLIVGFVVKFLPEYKNKIYRFETPIIGVKKGKKLSKWVYDFNEPIKTTQNEVMKYYKGFGSWKKEDLKFVIEKDGINDMCVKLDITTTSIIDDWLNKKKIETRKSLIKENTFDINKL
jgi:DNA gyrase/topoisomerase IV subunit B